VIDRIAADSCRSQVALFPRPSSRISITSERAAPRQHAQEPFPRSSTRPRRTAERRRSTRRCSPMPPLPDMTAHKRQVQMPATRKGAVARLAGRGAQHMTSRNAGRAQARIAKTLEFIPDLQARRRSTQRGERPSTSNWGSARSTIRGLQYLLGHALPNFYFRRHRLRYPAAQRRGGRKRDYLANP